MNARLSLVVVPVFRDQALGIRDLMPDLCNLIPERKRPGIAPGPSHFIMGMD
jgi:hypothetical protein